MRTESEVESFKAEAIRIVLDCQEPECDGSLDSDCICVRKYQFEIEAYEACIPQDFWYTKTSDVTVNTENFKKYVKKYVVKLGVAHRKGYGLVFTGSNGVGKTTFLSYIGANAIRKGRTSYYSTVPELDHDLKKGFDDTHAKFRLEVMLTSDFLLLDEMNKETFKDIEKPTWFKTQLERILKKRFDENKPVLMATNATPSQLIATYGPTFASMLSGKYRVVVMTPGDIRPMLSKKMLKEMDYE